MNLKEYAEYIKSGKTSDANSFTRLQQYAYNQNVKFASDVSKSVNSFIGAITNRYFDENGNYIDQYRADDKKWIESASQTAAELSDNITKLAKFNKQYNSKSATFSKGQQELQNAQKEIENLVTWLKELPQYTDENDYNTKKQQYAQQQATKEKYSAINISDIFGRIEELEQLQSQIKQSEAEKSAQSGELYSSISPFNFSEFANGLISSTNKSEQKNTYGVTPTKINLSKSDADFLEKTGYLEKVQKGNKVTYLLKHKIENLPPVEINVDIKATDKISQEQKNLSLAYMLNSKNDFMGPNQSPLLYSKNRYVEMTEDKIQSSIKSGIIYEKNGNYYQTSDNKEVKIVQSGTNTKLQPVTEEFQKEDFSNIGYKYINPFDYNKDNIDRALLSAKESLHNVSYVQATFNFADWYTSFENKEDWSANSQIPETPTSEDNKKLKLYNTEEKQIYYYLKNTGGQESADKWLTVMTSTVNKRNDEKLETAYSKLAEELPILSDIASIGYNILAAIEYIPQISSYMKTGYLKTNQLSKLATTIRQYRTESIDWNLGNWDAFDFVYNAGMSTIDSLVASSLPGKSGGLVLGISAASSATNDALERGMRGEQAFLHGVFNGATEMIFESVSIGNLKAFETKNIIGKKGLIKELVKTMVVNASEETCTEIANIVYDTLVNGDYSQVSIWTKEYLNKGMSIKEAEKQVKKDIAYQLAEATASGFISGGAMGGVASVLNYKRGSALGKQVKSKFSATEISDLFDYAKSKYSYNTDINEVISKYNSKNVSDNALGVLYSSIVSEIGNRLDSCCSILELNNKVIQILTESDGSIVLRNAVISLREEAAHNIAKRNKNGSEIKQLELNNDLAFFGKKYFGRYSTEQASALSRINNRTLNNAVSYFYSGDVFQKATTVQNNGGSVKVVQSANAINNHIPKDAIGMSGSTYDGLKKAGLTNSDGTINGYAIMDEFARRNEVKNVDVQKIVSNGDSVLPEVLAKGPEADPVADYVFEAKGVERLTEDQKFIKQVGKAFGREVKFKNLDEWRTDENGKRYLFSPGGKYNKSTGVIYINTSENNSENPISWIFKHELTHFAENNAKSYTDFINGVMDSAAFKDWVKSKGFKESENVSATTKMNEEYVSRWKFKGNNAEHRANLEMVADFVAENLFIDELSRLEKAINELQPKQIKTFKDLILSIFEKLKSVFQKRGYNNIDQIEREFVRICDEAMKAWETKTDGQKENSTTEGGVQYSIAQDETFVKYCDSIDQIESNDDISQKGQYVEVSQQTPSIIIKKANAKDLPMAILFDTAYLETRHDGKLSGNYHNLGADNMKLLPKLLETPEYIVKLANGRLNVIVDLATSKGKHTLVSIELDQSKQVKGKFNRYNLIITAFSTKSGYLDKIVSSPDNEVLYNKKTELQGTDQLHKGLDGINDSVSNDRITQKELSVNSYSMQESAENFEDVQYYRNIDVNEKGEVDILPPTKLDVKAEAARLEKRFGKYKYGTNVLEQQIWSITEQTSPSNVARALAIAEKIAANFENVEQIGYPNILRHINYTVVNQQLGYLNHKERSRWDRRAERQEKKIAQKDRQLAEKDKQIKNLESKVEDSHKYHNEMELKRLKREDRSKNLIHIRQVFNRLNTRLQSNTDAKHIPENMKGLVKAYLETFKFGNVEVDGKIQRRRLTQKDISHFMQQYKSVEFYTDGTPNTAYDESIVEFLNYLYNEANKSEKGLLISDLDNYDILMFSNLTDNVWQMVKSADEAFREGKAVKFGDIARRCFDDIKAHTNKNKFRANFKQWTDELATGNITPPYFFRRLGYGFYELYNDIVKGSNKWALNMSKAKSFVEKVQKKYNYSNWKNDRVTLRTERGQNIELTVEQAMQLYATVRRQLGNRKQDAQHLNIGGIVLKDSISSSNWDKIKNDLEKIKRSDLKDDQKANKIKEVWDAFHERYVNEAIQLTLNDLMNVDQLLTEEQKGYTKAWTDYLSNNMAALGNETSMLLFGYEKFTEKNYIPYNSAENYLYSQPGAPKGDERIKHLSFTKSTQIKAATPLVLSSLSEVCAAHVDKMCMYNALAVPLENLNKVFNCTVRDENGTPTKNMKTTLGNAFGNASVDYLKRFIEDVNGSVRGSNEDSLASSLTAKYKKVSVLANLSVAIQQPSAIFRTFAYINPKYFFRLKDVKGVGKNFEQMCKYVGVAVIKDMGRFDTGVGVSNTTWLLGQKTLKEKAEDALSILATKADEITWGHIWTMVKAEVADTTDLKVGSKAFFEKCAERTTEIINLTQVYDSTLVKSQHMRDKTWYKKAITSFMAEPTVTYNMLADAIYRAKSEGKSGTTFTSRAIGAVLLSTTINVLLKSIIYAMRDDDEEKSYIEKYLKKVTENSIQELNVLNLIPLVRDILSIWQGYDIERVDMSIINDLILTIKALDSENKTTGEKLEALVGDIAAFYGIPVNNVVRDIKAVAKTIIDMFDSESDLTTVTGIKYAMLEGVPKLFGGISGDKISSYYDKMAEAAEQGDEETYMEIYSLLLENDHEVSDILSEVKSAVKEIDAVEDKTDEHIENLKSNSTYEMLDDDDKKKLESKIKEALAFDYLDKLIPGSDAQYDKLYKAKRSNSKKYKKLKEELMNSGVSQSELDVKLFMAEIRYIEGKGINVRDWALAEVAKSKKYADTDGSGGVSKSEIKKAINNMDVDEKTKKDLWSYYYGK